MTIIDKLFGDLNINTFLQEVFGARRSVSAMLQDNII